MPRKTIRILTIKADEDAPRQIPQMLDQATDLGWDLPQFELIHTATLAAGLAHLEDQDADLVLVDLDLPDDQPDSVLAQLRAHAPRVPLVVIASRQEVLAGAGCAGAEICLLERELNGPLLAHTLLHAIERQRTRATLAEAHNTLEQQVQERTAYLEAANEQLRQEIAERKKAEMALQENEEKYRSLFNQSISGIYLHDLEGRILDVNETACLQSGYSRDEILRLTVFDLHPDNVGTANMGRDEILHLWSQWKPDQRAVVQGEHKHKNGTIFPVEISTGIIRFRERNLMLAIVQDITERKRAAAEREKLQAQLAQAQKMEAVGRLAGGVAHDFNNMLGVIIGHAELAVRQIDPAHPLYTDLAEIHHAARRSADLTRQLLAFARKQIVVPRVLDPNDTIAGMLKMLRRLIGEDIDLVWVPGVELWPVKIDPGQLNQILINLCLNARDAITHTGRSGVGTITVETHNIVCDESYGAGRTDFVPGDYVELAVGDDGCGMDRNVLANLFEPYFTTKAEGQSGGLGLATVYGAVKQNGGFVQVQSEPGQGTTFTIYLPRSTGQAMPAETPGPNIPGGRETVLVVEDEPAVLRLARAVLERLGYRVLVASRPGEALRVAAEYTGTIDLLITDVVLPEMSGGDLAARIANGHPGAKYLFVSGHAAKTIAHEGMLEDGVHFLQKPFSIDELALKVREILDAAGIQA